MATQAQVRSTPQGVGLKTPALPGVQFGPRDFPWVGVALAAATVMLFFAALFTSGGFDLPRPEGIENNRPPISTMGEAEFASPAEEAGP